MEFRIYPLEDTARLPELCDLFAKGLAQTTAEMWLWKHYTENGLPEGMILVAEDETGKLRAMFAMQPAWYRRGNERILLVQTEDLVIDPECRGQGLMRKLYDYTMDHYRQQGAIALTAFSCNDASYPIFLKYGAKALRDIGSIATPKSLIPKKWRKATYDKDGLQILVCDQMPKDLFCAPCETAFKMENTYRTLQWRFSEDPGRSYQWLTIRKDSRLVGWLVFYVNKGRLRSAVNICHWELLDCVDAKTLAQAILILQRLGHWVSLWGIQTPDALALWHAAGLTKVEPAHDHFMYHIINDQTPPTAWYITKVDSDN